MSGKTKLRNQANSAEDLTLSLNEKILRECHSMYTDPEKGLVVVGKNVGLKILPPRKKITVMLMGNHSAGKSSFINWYIEEHILKTGVAIETQGFAFVTSGKKRESLTGNATLHLFPHFQPLQDIDGVMDYLSTEISSSKQKKFPLVIFIDTPGLVDGDMKYPFDVNGSIQWFGEMCDLILVFFDPIGQALCKRTLNIVEKINESHPEKLRFFLSKADEAGHENDRQRVMMQIVQELCKRPGLNKTGFDMPTIYIPNSNKQTRCVNQIEETCKNIEKTINQTIQTTLNTLEKDCDRITELLDRALDADNAARAHNYKAKLKAMGFSLFGFLLPVLLLTQLMVASAPRSALNSIVGESFAESLSIYMGPLTAYWEEKGDENQLLILAVTLVLSGIFLITSRVVGKMKPTLQNQNKRILVDRKSYLDNHVKPQKQKLYSEYLKQSVPEHDL